VIPQVRPVIAPPAAQPFLAADAGEARLFTFTLAGERFALPVSRVQTVFRFERVTPIPFAPPAIFGLANLRGKIITAVSLRARLGLSPEGGLAGRYAVCVERGAESFGLSVDEVGDVLRLSPESRLPTPAHVDPARSALTICVYPLSDGILPMLDVDAILKFERN